MPANSLGWIWYIYTKQVVDRLGAENTYFLQHLVNFSDTLWCHNLSVLSVCMFVRDHFQFKWMSPFDNVSTPLATVPVKRLKVSWAKISRNWFLNIYYIRSKVHKRSPVTNALLARPLGLETSCMTILIISVQTPWSLCDSTIKALV